MRPVCQLNETSWEVDGMSKIRILIVDDHAIVREGLREILQTQEQLQVVGEAVDGADAVSKTVSLKPDVVLMDIAMPGTGGLQACREIKKLKPEVKTLILTMHDSEEYFLEIFSVGASGYFVKGGSSRELVQAIQAVSRGEFFLHPTMTSLLLTQYQKLVSSDEAKESPGGLSPRESEILKLTAEGRSDQEVADLLSLSRPTVQAHRARIAAKLRLHNRTDLIRYALRHGIITLSSRLALGD